MLPLLRFLSDPILSDTAPPTHLYAAANGVHAAVAEPSLRLCSVFSWQVPWLVGVVHLLLLSSAILASV